MVSTTKDPQPERETRRQPSIPQTASIARQPRQKAQLHRPVRRSRSIPRENPENIRRRVRDFGETSGSAGQGSVRVSKQTNRHSFDALSVERCQDFDPGEESTTNVAANRRPCSARSTTDTRDAQVRDMSWMWYKRRRGKQSRLNYRMFKLKMLHVPLPL